jgi:hypothetical protein
MEHFNKIVEHLDVSCIVIIENDLKPESNAETILAKYSILSEVNKIKLLEKLTSKGFSSLSEKLKTFDEKFATLPHNEHKLTFLSTGELSNYLKSLKDAPDITSTCNEIKTDIEKNSSVSDVFFQYGITTTELPAYKPFIDQVFEKSDYKPCVLLFEDVTSTSFDEFKTDLRNALQGTTYSFIAIVDKMLGNGEPNGLKIVNEYITSISKECNLTAYPFILTSQAISTPDPDDLKKYNQLVVSKTSENLIDDVCNAISINAYSQIFNYFETQTSESLKKTSETAGKNKNNIAYIVNKANEEGMLPYEAIRIWYENALNLYINAAITNGGNPVFKSTIGLSKLIAKIGNEEADLPDDFKNHLKELNTNEIFDYSINAKHLPIAPGDIFVSGENYFVLIGQVCDVSLRDDLSRNSKLAKVVTASYEALRTGKKYRKVEREKEFVKFSCFKNQNQENGLLKIELKTKSTTYIDYAILDLCMYNADGKCIINTLEPLERPLLNYFAEANIKYYKALQEKMSELENISVEVRTALTDKTNGLFAYDKTDNIITFPFQRICRIKGNFNHLIHHNYWHYRSRTDLNEINFTEE